MASAIIGLSSTVLLTAPSAYAYPTCDGGYQVSSPFGGYCDGFPEPAGQHWHCQWGFGFSLCEWRWADNTPAPNPYIPQAEVPIGGGQMAMYRKPRASVRCCHHSMTSPGIHGCAGPGCSS